MGLETHSKGERKVAEAEVGWGGLGGVSEEPTASSRVSCSATSLAARSMRETLLLSSTATAALPTSWQLGSTADWLLPAGKKTQESHPKKNVDFQQITRAHARLYIYTTSSVSSQSWHNYISSHCCFHGDESRKWPLKTVLKKGEGGAEGEEEEETEEKIVQVWSLFFGKWKTAFRHGRK